MSRYVIQAKEDPRAVCPDSTTGLHYHVVIWSQTGPIENKVTRCEVCLKPIKAVGPRWFEDMYIINEMEDLW